MRRLFVNAPRKASSPVDPWINFFVVLTVGANVATLVVRRLALVARSGQRRRDRRHGCEDASARTANWHFRRSWRARRWRASLYLSEGAYLPPCRLCWYQRIACIRSQSSSWLPRSGATGMRVRTSAHTPRPDRPIDPNLPLPDRAVPEFGRTALRAIRPIRATSRASSGCTTSPS